MLYQSLRQGYVAKRRKKSYFSHSMQTDSRSSIKWLVEWSSEGMTHTPIEYPLEALSPGKQVVVYRTEYRTLLCITP